MIDTPVVNSLKTLWQELKTEQPRLRIRNAAEVLGVSEAALLATQIGENVTRLEADWKTFLHEVKNLGHVMALTRNYAVVHERKGVYNNVSFQGPVGLVLDPNIDLRLFMHDWTFAFSVQESGPNGKVRYSIQFFDSCGEAIHKIYATDKTNMEEWESLTSKYKAPEQVYPEFKEKTNRAQAEIPDAQVDVKAFQEGWKGLKDTHDFYMLVRNHKLSRTQALRLAPEGMVRKLQPNAFRQVLDKAAAQKLEIMVFVGNPGCIQIHTGLVKNVMEHEGWYNVMDPEFNLHIREEAITQSYVVKKPTSDGIVTAVECYDNEGELLVQYFGKRKPGIPEMAEWQVLCESLI